jgi:hypothetical protein
MLPRIELARGRWLRFERPMYISDRRALSALADGLPEDATLLDAWDRAIAIVEPVVAERSWDGPFDQFTNAELQAITQQWADQTEDAALPPE